MSEAEDALTLDSVVIEAENLLRDWLQLLREILQAVSDFETANPGRSEEEKAVSRWVIYLGVMMAKSVDGILVLIPTQNVRVLQVLARTLFEYQQKARYFIKNPGDALGQYASIQARLHAELAKAKTPSLEIRTAFIAAHEEWKKSHPGIDEYSGNRSFAKMVIAIAKPDDVQTDDSNQKWTFEYQAAYGFPSLYVHGQAPLMPEVFPKLGDGTNWEFREDVTFFDVLATFDQANSSMLPFCKEAIMAYRLESLRSRYNELHVKFKRVVANEKIVSGFPSPSELTHDQ